MDKLLNFVRARLSKISVFDYSLEYLVENPRVLVKCIRDEVLFAYQRMTKGYDAPATYNVDSHLSEHIPALLRELKAWGNVNPVWMPASPKEHESGEGYEDDYARWHAILDEMIAGFEAAKALEGIGPIWEEFWAEWKKRYPEEDEYLFEEEEDEDGYVRSEENPYYKALMEEMDLWERDKQWRQEQMKLFHRGMILFHIYYFNLWD